MFYYLIMELYQLKGFAEVARLGNLTKAAEKLNLTQPALSIQIKQLEDELGESLFERVGRGLVLSAVGKIMLLKAESVLSAAEQMKNEIDEIEELKTGSVTIGTNDSNCLHVLPRVISAFRNDYPGVTIHLENSHSRDVVNWVKAGQVELGIVTLPASCKDLTAEELYTREDVLIMPPGHPLEKHGNIRPGDLKSYPMLVLNKGSISHNSLLNVLAGSAAEPEKLLRVGSIEVIKRYTEIGLGIAVVPFLNVSSEVESGRLVIKQLHWLPKLSVGIVYRTNSRLSPAAREFLLRLREYTSGIG